MILQENLLTAGKFVHAFSFLFEHCSTDHWTVQRRRTPCFFFKKYFAQNKKHGSRDRKLISHLCYCYFRLGKSASPNPPQREGLEERILAGLFLCSEKPNEILEQLKPGWNKQIDLPVRSKLLIINSSLLIADVFPWKNELSEGIDHDKFCESFFAQPDLFLRLRPGYEDMAKKKLRDAGFDFKEIDSSCLSLANNSKFGNTIELDKEAIIQDYSSQQTAEFLKMPIADSKSPISAWDCCAGSGGKSMLLYDMHPDIDFTVSDVRESILVNLRKRFARAGIKRVKPFVTDLTNNRQPGTGNFDLIICDAPCTGSGTWSRTPEQLYFFEERKIEQYATLQKKIITNTISHLKRNGFLVYITCSVFKKENEEVVEYIEDTFKVRLVKQELLKGYDRKADTMFAALFRKEL